LDPALDAQHAGDAGPEDVGVDELDPGADVLEGEREMDSDGGFAHAALAAAHRNDVADARQLVLISRRLGRRGLHG
jgi:hypothetical protein